MRKPRVGFRSFLLMTVLASLVAATLALRARLGDYQSALDQSNRAARARAQELYMDFAVEWYEGQIVRAPSPAEKARWQARIKQARASQVKFRSEAEHHERLARY